MKSITAIPAALRAAFVGLAAAAVLVACGGGVGTGGTGGDATAYAAGPITGFGSVIVGGVRFDDTGAAVEDGDGGRRSRDELRLGMTVEVESSALATDASGTTTGRAARISFESEIVGAVGLVNASASTFRVLGQTVLVDATTVFDDRLTGGLAGLATGQSVEVYAVFDGAQQQYRATRVQPTSQGSGFLRLRGPIRALDATAQTLTIGATSYSYAQASNVPVGLAVGQFVRLRLEVQALRWVVQSFGAAPRALVEGEGIKVEGLVSAFTSTASFSVNGRAVDASAATFPAGTTGLVVGARVELEGTVRNGAFRATQVKVVTEDEASNRGFELIGAITATTAAPPTITLRGVTVSTARSGLRIDNGTAANLVVGQQVEVKGGLSADRLTLEATRIKIVR